MNMNDKTSPLSTVAVDPLVSEFDEELCLQVNPFEGDFGTPADRCLKDKVGIARKPGPCSLCGQEIQPKERIRMAAYIFDGEMHSYRWCSSCCSAMAKSWSDDGKAYEERILLSR
jgi:hypothetical protein